MIANDVPAARFVILEHEWRGVHWDLMLEAAGALRTWALSAPPTLGVEIEAGALPDHRLAYLDYEGPVSRDRGEVRRFDQGTFEPVSWSEDAVEVRLSGDRVRGMARLEKVDDSGEDGRSGWRFLLKAPGDW